MKYYPPLELQFPVSCQINENCWIINSDNKETTGTKASPPKEQTAKADTKTTAPAESLPQF